MENSHFKWPISWGAAHAGHVSMRMLRRYSHIQLEAKRTAIQALSNRPQQAASEVANVTNHVTKQGEAEGCRGKLLKIMVGPNGLEPLTSTVSR